MREKVKRKLLKIVAQNYSLIADDFNISRQKHVWPEMDKFAQQVFPGAKVLDAACGNGRLLEVLQNKDICYDGFDSSSELIELAKKNYPNRNFFVHDLLAVKDIKSHDYDFIFLVAALLHIPSKELREAVVKSLVDKLKPGAKLIISVWNLYSQKKFKALIFWSELKRILFFSGLDKGDLLFYWKNNKGEKVSQRYYHVFSSKELKKLFHKFSLNIEEFDNSGRNIWLVLSKKD